MHFFIIVWNYFRIGQLLLELPMKRLTYGFSLSSSQLSPGSYDSKGFSNKNSNVNEMVEVLENFHDECMRESKHFQGSGERSLFRSWDNKFDKKDVDLEKERKPTHPRMKNSDKYFLFLKLIEPRENQQGRRSSIFRYRK